MSAQSLLITIILFGSLVILLALGLPLVFCLFAVALAGLFAFMRWRGIILVFFNTTNAETFWMLYSVPLFIFMAGMLERSGVGEDLYRCMQLWTGGLAGGLAMGTIFISTIFAAMVGESSAALLTIGIIALPSMLKRGYDKYLAMGCIMAGGALGVLIPPSVIMVIYATQVVGYAEEYGISIGKLFFGGIMPGLLLSSLFIVYIGIRCYLHPSLGPPLAPEEQASWKDKLMSLRAVILPSLIVILVLGAILKGVATALEAAAIGAAGAIVSAAIYRRLTWQNFKETSYITLRLTAMIVWIYIAARCLRVLYFVSGTTGLVRAVLLTMPLGRWGALIGMQFMLFILGCFLDPIGIVLIAMPVFAPLATALGFHPLWFGILFVLNMEMSYLTPPTGLNLFYMKGIVPEDVTMADIYRSVVPFVLIQGLALVLVMMFPQIALWLPSRMMR